jgi:hypothetical protein
MNRRLFLGAALGAAATLAVVRFASEPVQAAPGAPGTPANPDRTMQENGQWMTHLLPFAAPFPTEAAAHAAVAQGRKLGLFQ